MSANRINGNGHHPASTAKRATQNAATSTSIDLTRGMYRRIYAGFINGRRINAVTLEAEAWFWRINSIADDYGNAVGDVALLYNETAGRRDQVTRADVERWRDELAAAGLIVLYNAGGDTYLHVVGFGDLQPAGRNGKRVRRRPPFPGDEGEGNAGESGGGPGDSNGLDSPGDANGVIPGSPGDLRAQHKHKHKHKHEHQHKQKHEHQHKQKQTNPPNPPRGARSSRSASKPAVPGDALPAGFAAFWAAWPSHERKVDPKKCASLWVRNCIEASAADVMAGLRRWKASASWAKDGGAFIPGPHRWLNRREWEATNITPAEVGTDGMPPIVPPSTDDLRFLFGNAKPDKPDTIKKGVIPESVSDLVEPNNSTPAAAGVGE